MNLVIRTQGEPRGVAAQVRREIEAVDPTQAIFKVRPFEEMLSDTIADRRFNLILLLTFALVAAMTAASGIYATMTYFVTQQIPELGIRMALGARSRDVLKLIMVVGMKLTVCGVSIGLLAALVVGRLMTTLLFGVTPTDVTTFTIVSILLLGLASIACYIPARRATKVDPLIALKYE
jgi:putative ABC transport system permease protein